MAADQFADVLENCGIAAADTSGLVSALSSKPSAATAPSAEAESVVYKMVKDEFTGANKNKNKNSAKQEVRSDLLFCTVPLQAHHHCVTAV